VKYVLFTCGPYVKNFYCWLPEYTLLHEASLIWINEKEFYGHSEADADVGFIPGGPRGEAENTG
jgi:hypothetical protein